MIKNLVFILALFALSCSNANSGGYSTSITAAPADSAAPGAGQNPPPVDAPSPEPNEFKIDFSFVNWPTDMSESERRALRIALNISGSFEGRESWANITDNSDGQGMSLGLLSQNFGSGTLQPLLIQMRDAHPEVLAKIFSPAHLVSLYGMLKNWETNPIKPVGILSVEKASPLDDTIQENSFENSTSVNWAVKNLYHKGQFIQQWRDEFQALAASAEYVNLQFDEALKMHVLAKDYVSQVGVSEIRSYLMMFDIVDQNGYVYPEDFADYNRFLTLNKITDSTSRLEKLLELRLRHVSSRYALDVKSRKLAIIKGRGVVHGLSRNLEQEYSFVKTQNF